MSGITVFLSCVSAEFQTYRDSLRRSLETPTINVKIQEDFIPSGTPTLIKLDEYVRLCDVVVHLIGDMSGASVMQPSLDALAARYPDLATRIPAVNEMLSSTSEPGTYTQWEAWLALYHGKRLFIAIPTPSAVRGPRYLLDDTQRATQERHLERLRRHERFPEFPFADPGTLSVELLRGLQDVVTAYFLALPSSASPLPDYLRALAALRVSEYDLTDIANVSCREVFVPPRLQRVTSGSALVPSAVDATLRDILLSDRHVSESRCLCVRGPAGSGKSSLLRYIAKHAWYEPDRIGQDLPCIPFLIKLRHLATSKGTSLGQLVANAIAQDGALGSASALPDDPLAAWKAQAKGRFLLLLDAMDEVPAERVAAVASLVSRFIDEGHRIIITARPSVQLPKTLSDRTVTLEIQSLTDDEQASLLHGLVPERAASLKSAVEAFHLSWLRRNPLLLSLAAVVYDTDEELPPRRVELYERVITQWLKRSGSLGPTGTPADEFLPFSREILEVAALHMSLLPGTATSQDVLAPIAAYLASRTGKPQLYYNHPNTGGEILSLIGRRTGVFEVSGPSCHWLHPTFREFLAASHLATLGLTGDPRATLREHLSDSSWRQIALMCLTMLRDKVDIDDFLRSLASSGDESILLAAEVVLEGARVSSDTMLAVVRAVAHSALAASSRSLCEALLTSRVSQESLLTVAGSLLQQPGAEDIRQDVVACLVALSGSHRSYTSLQGWNPRWFDFLELLNAWRALRDIYEDTSVGTEARILAFQGGLKEHNDVDVSDMDAALTVARSSDTAVSILIRTACSRGLYEWAFSSFLASDLTWTNALKASEAVGANPSHLAFSFPLPHRLSVTTTLALAWACHTATDAVPEPVVVLLSTALEHFSSSTRPGSASDCVPSDVVLWALSLPELSGSLARSRLVAFSAQEGCFFDVTGYLANRVEPCDFTEWLASAEYSPAVLLLVTDSLVSRFLDSETDLQRIHTALAHHAGTQAYDVDTRALYLMVSSRLSYLARLDDGTLEATLQSIADMTDISVDVGGTQLGLALSRAAVTLLASHQRARADDGTISIATLRRYVKSHNPDAEITSLLGRYLYADGALRDAASVFSEWLRMAFGVDEFMIAALAQALQRADTLRRAQDVGVMRSDLPELSRAFGADLRYDRLTLTECADSFRYVGRWRDAIELSTVCASHEETRQFALQVRGAALLITSPAAAIADFEAALSLDSSSLFSAVRLAWAHRLVDNPHAARAATTRLLTLDPEDWDGLHLQLELEAQLGSTESSLSTLLDEMRDKGVRDDVIGFVRLLSTTEWSDDVLAAFAATVKNSRASYFPHIGDFWDEPLAHFVVYAAVVPDVVDHKELLTHAMSQDWRERLACTSLALCRHLTTSRPNVSARAAAIAADIEAMLAQEAPLPHSTPDDPPSDYPPSASYPFPMYCRLASIEGLEREGRYCAQILRVHARRDVRSVLLIRLDQSERVFGACNFPLESGDAHSFKFCDSLDTVLSSTLRSLVVDQQVKSFIFLDDALRLSFDASLRTQKLNATTALQDIRQTASS